jgi:hypothetical protein
MLFWFWFDADADANKIYKCIEQPTKTSMVEHNRSLKRPWYYTMLDELQRSYRITSEIYYNYNNKKAWP